MHQRVQDHLPESSTLGTQTGSSAPTRELPFNSRECFLFFILFCFPDILFTNYNSGVSWQFEPAFSIHKLPVSTHLHQKLLFPSTQTIFQELPCRLNVQLTMLHVCVLVIFLFIVCLVHKVTIKQASQLHTIYALLSVCPLVTLGFPVPSDLLPLVLLPLSCVLFFEHRFCI